MSDTEKKSEPANNRWWESYLVRYFLGFIVGIVCVVVLAWKFGLLDVLLDMAKAVAADPNGKGNKEPVKPDWSYIAFAAALLGLGYCYLASTPITVLHAGRFGRDGIASLSRYFWFGWVITLVLSLVSWGQLSAFPWEPPISGILCAICGAASLGMYMARKDGAIFPLAPADKTEARYHTKGADGAVAPPHSPTYQVSQSLVFALGIWSFVSFFCGLWQGTGSAQAFPLLLFGVPVIWIGGMQYTVLRRLLTEEPKVNRFYAHLFHARRQEGGRDVRDTYSHLREHSNSIFVVLIELCWLALLLGVSSLSKLPVPATTGPIPSGIPYVLFAIGIWVMPTVFMWSRANAMERFFSENPGVFLENPMSSDGAKMGANESCPDSPTHEAKRTDQATVKIELRIMD